MTASTTARVLTVEDDPIVRADLRLILEDAGFDVSDARDGLEAVEVARTDRPDLILIDVSLPQIDGVEEANIPVVALKLKPFHEAELVETIADALEAAERERRHQLIRVESMVRHGHSEREIADALRGR